MADKLLCIPVWASRRPGPQTALKAVFDKRKACLDEKRSRFNIFCTHSQRSLFLSYN